MTEKNKNGLLEINIVLGNIARNMQSLLICPVCATQAVAIRDFAGSEDGHFKCVCHDCSAEWGTRVCDRCKKKFPVIITHSDCRVDWFLPVLLLQFVFTLPSDFAEDAALLQYCTSCYQAPLRTVLALFTHTAPHMVIYRALNMLTMILGFGSGNSFNMLENSSQFRQPRLPRRLSHL